MEIASAFGNTSGTIRSPCFITDAGSYSLGGLSRANEPRGPNCLYHVASYPFGTFVGSV